MTDSTSRFNQTHNKLSRPSPTLAYVVVEVPLSLQAKNGKRVGAPHQANAILLQTEMRETPAPISIVFF
jgi:hypothetical protein